MVVVLHVEVKHQTLPAVQVLHVLPHVRPIVKISQIIQIQAVQVHHAVQPVLPIVGIRQTTLQQAAPVPHVRLDVTMNVALGVRRSVKMNVRDRHELPVVRAPLLVGSHVHMHVTIHVLPRASRPAVPNVLL